MLFIAIESYKNGKWPEQIPRDLPKLLDLPFDAVAHLANSIFMDEGLYSSLPKMIPLYINGVIIEGPIMIKKESIWADIIETLTGIKF